MSLMLRSYPHYTEDRLSWIDRLPIRWTSVRLRHVAGLNPSKSEAIQIRRRDEPVAFVPMEAVSTSGGISVHDLRPAHEVWKGFSYFRRGDVLVAKITPCFENGKGAFVSDLPTEIGFGSTEFVVLRPRALIDGAFLYRVTTLPQFRNMGRDAMTGAAGQQRVPTDFIKDFVIPLPPLDEQRLIARYCAYLDARVNRLVRAKRRLIALLTEQKQAIIQQAVTRGLDPDAPMKPSGVAWLGNIPAHWNLMPLHRITDPNRPVMYGIVLPGPNVDDGVMIVKGGNCRQGRLAPEFLSRTTYEIESRYVRSRLQTGDLVYAIRGSIGDAAIIPEAIAGANLTQDAARIAPCSGIDRRWLLHAVQSPAVFQQLDAGARGATIRGVNIRDLKRAVMAVPSASEQEEIARFLDCEVSEIHKAIDRITREIDLIREYRTRLVADVVAGQLDVRAAAAALPDIDPLDAAGDDGGVDLDDLTDGESDADDAALADEMSDAAD